MTRVSHEFDYTIQYKCNFLTIVISKRIKHTVIYIVLVNMPDSAIEQKHIIQHQTEDSNHVILSSCSLYFKTFVLGIKIQNILLNTPVMYIREHIESEDDIMFKPVLV